MFAALLPTLQCADRNAQQRGELSLRQAGGLAGLHSRRKLNFSFTGLHVFDRLKNLGADVSLRFESLKVSGRELLRFRGHGESPLKEKVESFV